MAASTFPTRRREQDDASQSFTKLLNQDRRRLKAWLTCSDGQNGIDKTSGVVDTVHMNELEFAWDEKKNRANQRKHGISSEEAQTVFDEKAIRYDTTR